MDFNADFLAACEGLVANEITNDSHDHEISAHDINRWQDLFHFSHAEAVNAIKEWRSDVGRAAITEASWDMIRDSWPGFDKESYAFALARGIFNSPVPRATAVAGAPPGNGPAAKTSSYLLRLDPGLPSVGILERIVEASSPLRLYWGSGMDNSDETTTAFCIVDGVGRSRILDYLSAQQSPREPLFVRYSEASKDLSATSVYPTLGIRADPTLPQLRINAEGQAPPPSPSQNEYPVWYFFYGTLGQPETLSRVLNVAQEELEEKLLPARTRGGRLVTWGGKYKGLVDAEERDSCQGWAYMVRTRDEEDALRLYETDMYEVARCEIEFTGGDNVLASSVAGLTFRFMA